jgi:predicted ATPase
MIKRLRVQGYKSLSDVEINFDNLTVIFGPNAVGKSNLFDALSLLSRIVSSRTLTAAIEGHRGDPLEAFDCSRDGLEGLLRKDRVSFIMEVDVALSPANLERVKQRIQAYRAGISDSDTEPTPMRRWIKERFLRYKIKVEMIPKTGILRVQDESLLALRMTDGKLFPDERRKHFLERVDNRLRLRMEGQARPTDYELGLDYSIISQSLYPPHYPHITAFREEVSSWCFYYFEPRLMREENPLKEVLTLKPSGGDLAAFYHTLNYKNPKQYDNIKRILSNLVPTITELAVEPTEEGKIKLKIKEGVFFSAKVISEGTLRILGLLAILSSISPTTIVGFEEPENGVHPRRLKLIGDLLRNAAEQKQIIVNTHSPILANYLTDAYLVSCKKRNGSTIFEPITTKPLLHGGEIENGVEEEEPTPMLQRIMRGDFDD